MKRNTKSWIVPGLTVVVVLIFFYRIGSLVWSRFKSTATTQVVATKSRSSATATTTTNQPPVKAAPIEPAAPVDVSYVSDHLRLWLESPHRDPFLVYQPLVGPTNNLPSANELFILKAIWRQTGSRLAVIDTNLVSESDCLRKTITQAGKVSTVEYVVERIEWDQVRLKGPKGRESLLYIPPGGALPSRGDTNIRVARAEAGNTTGR